MQEKYTLKNLALNYEKYNKNTKTKVSKFTINTFNLYYNDWDLITNFWPRLYEVEYSPMPYIQSSNHIYLMVTRDKKTIQMTRNQT